MDRRRLIATMAAVALAVSGAGSVSAFSRSPQAPVSRGTVLRVLHAPIRWAMLQPEHSTLASAKSGVIRMDRGTAILGGHTVFFLKTIRAAEPGSANSTAITMGFPSGTLSGRDQAYDSMFSSDGTTVTETDYADGTLAYDTGSSNFVTPSAPHVNPDDPCASGVTCSGLTYRFSACGGWTSKVDHTEDCYHVYSASTSSRTYGYRLGWWTGSSNSQDGYKLQGVVLRNGMAGCSQCGVQELDWSPASTRYLSSGSLTTTLGFNLQFVSASVSENLLIYSQSYGPTPNYPTSTQFQFQWFGDVSYNTVIGMGGGEEWQFNEAHGYPLYNFITLYIV